MGLISKLRRLFSKSTVDDKYDLSTQSKDTPKQLVSDMLYSDTVDTTVSEAELSEVSVDCDDIVDNKPNPTSGFRKPRPVLAMSLTTDQRFESITKCAEYFGVSRSTIKKSIDNPDYHCKKLSGYSFVYLDGREEGDICAYKQQPR